MKLWTVTLLGAGAMMASDAGAALITLEATGTVSHIAANVDGMAVAIPGSSINLLDTFLFTATFDTSDAALYPGYEADPTVNHYFLNNANAVLKVGEFITNFSIVPSVHGLQLQNDNGGTDAQLYSIQRYGDLSALLPFSMGGSDLGENLLFQATDFTGTSRSNDAIDDLKPFSLFDQQVIRWNFVNFENHLAVNVIGKVTSATLTVSAVPEPKTWAMMIAGFGLLGASLRRVRHSKTAFQFSQ